MQGPKMAIKDKSLNWLVRYVGVAQVLVSENLHLCFHVNRMCGFSQVFFWTYFHIHKMSLTPTCKSHLWIRKIKWMEEFSKLQNTCYEEDEDDGVFAWG